MNKQQKDMRCTIGVVRDFLKGYQGTGKEVQRYMVRSVELIFCKRRGNILEWRSPKGLIAGGE